MPHVKLANAIRRLTCARGMPVLLVLIPTFFYPYAVILVLLLVTALLYFWDSFSLAPKEFAKEQRDQRGAALLVFAGACVLICASVLVFLFTRN